MHDLAGALKFHLREAKEPAIPFDLYDAFLKTHDGQSVSSEKIEEAVKLLSESRRSVLGSLMRLLSMITAQSDVNLMPPENIGIVFGPTLLRDKQNQFDIGVTGTLADIVVSMVNLSDHLFTVCFSFCPSL